MMIFIWLLLEIPIAGVIAITLRPLWSWIEATTGIESIGHSGPATWCFLLTYITITLLAILAMALVRPGLGTTKGKG
jgi:predicted PurR-regulated permease PerM